MRSRRVRVFALVLLTGLGWSAWASCTHAAPASEEQMACCIAGHHDCEPGGQAARCCETAPRIDHQFTTASAVHLAAPVLSVVGIVPPSPASALEGSRPSRLDVHPARPQPTDRPLYLLASVFLL